MGRKATLKEKKAWVASFQRVVKRYEDNGLSVPSVAKIAKSIGIDVITLKNYLKAVGVDYESGDRGGNKPSESVLQKVV